jgi:hypothetical protein
VVRCTVLDLSNNVINFGITWTTKIINLMIRVANFCCSMAGLGEPFKVVPPAEYKGLNNEQKYKELNEKESRKK